MKSILKFVINLIDKINKNKIINFFKKKINNKFLTIIDVGAHEGETVLLFIKNFNLNKVICYEASSVNFKKLEKKINKKKKLKTVAELNNFGIGKENSKMKFYNTSESSSSTFCNINFDSDYFKRKKKILDYFFKEKYINRTETILIKPLKNEIERYGFKEIDILKIDTEGFEYNVLLGLEEKLSIIKYIYFEHHFDHMIVKNYTLSDIDTYLKKFNFKKVFKIKMPYRKTFEYIYENNN